MKRKYNILIFLCLLLACAGGGWYYYYNYVATINTFILIKYDPPQKEESIFGGYTYSQPKVEFEILPTYTNDSIGISVQKANFKKFQEYMIEEWDRIIQKPTPDDAADKLILEAKINALKTLMQQQRFLVRTTHIRKFSLEETLEMLKEHWTDKTMEKYAKKNKVDFAIYNI